MIRGLAEDDLIALMPVYETNPAYLRLTEGDGTYDLEKLQRDVAVARATPGRELAGIFLRATGEAVGVVDWMLENESDGKPWIGLLIIRADQQTTGLASEAFSGLAHHLREQGCSVVRAGVIEVNDAGRRLTHHLGFRQVGSKMMRFGSGEQTVLILERELPGEV
jgi:RimJ/RimL family protein N-acetyltransferase